MLQDSEAASLKAAMQLLSSTTPPVFLAAHCTARVRVPPPQRAEHRDHAPATHSYASTVPMT